MITNAIVIATAVGVAAMLIFWKRFAGSRSWLATVTPLASIMGSGFLVCAPILAATVGVYAMPAMAALLVFAYAIGGVARFNIRVGEPLMQKAEKVADHQQRNGHHRLFRGHRWKVRLARAAIGVGTIRRLEAVSQVVLAVAYLISVTYYLKLLAVFVLRGITGSEPGEAAAAALATGVIAVITGIGAVWGLRMLERVERYAVGVNLGMIAALLVGLAIYNGEALIGGTWTLPPAVAGADPVTTIRVLLGLLIVVQGFETSLFLGSEHPPEERARTMRRAQWISTGVYLVFLGLATILFPKLDLAGGDDGVTAVVALSGYAATVLPLLLIIAAAGSQFSAAVADDSGCGGLVSELLHGRIAVRWIYLALGTGAVLLTWVTDVTQIISIASRAFAVFYALQCGIGALVALRAPGVTHRRGRAFAYGLLAIGCAAVAVFGISADG